VDDVVEVDPGSVDDPLANDAALSDVDPAGAPYPGGVLSPPMASALIRRQALVGATSN
jgi:hypothetical protein